MLREWILAECSGFLEVVLFRAAMARQKRQDLFSSLLARHYELMTSLLKLLMSAESTKFHVGIFILSKVIDIQILVIL